jgi:hypothetical protein
MNRMAVPDEDDGTGDGTKDLFEKGDHIFTSQVMPIRLDAQSHSFAIWRDQQHAQKIETLMMVYTSAQEGCLPTTRPGPLERRHQGEAAFIFKTQRGAQLPTLFLSWAIHLPSRSIASSRDGKVSAEDADCSSPCASCQTALGW